MKLCTRLSWDKYVTTKARSYNYQRPRVGSSRVETQAGLELLWLHFPSAKMGVCCHTWLGKLAYSL